jgi:dipeptidase
MCDTFIAMPAATGDGSILFGKNSDREPNEAQSLEYHPGSEHQKGSLVACTHLKISQAEQTYATLISRPFWMWGAEMGANERGVVIGNEAVFTRMPMDKKGKLLGMDILRLALERSASAEHALEIMIQLLADYGQGGPCGYQNSKLTYHNSYIIADSRRAWVLETAGHLWAAARIEDYYSISNGLTIGEAYEESHPDLVSYARKKGWLKKHETFNFRRCYSDWYYTTFCASRKRQARAADLIRAAHGKLGLADAMHILRDHGSESYRPGGHLLMDRLCSHAANGLSRDSAQTTASMIAQLRPDLQTHWATGTSAPCTGLFKPIWFDDAVLPDIGPAPKDSYDPQCLWWLHEELHRAVIDDYAHRLDLYRQERDQLEAGFIQKTLMTPRNRYGFSVAAFEKAHAKTREWIEKVKQANKEGPQENWIFRNYWRKQNRVMPAA